MSTVSPEWKGHQKVQTFLLIASQVRRYALRGSRGIVVKGRKNAPEYEKCVFGNVVLLLQRFRCTSTVTYILRKLTTIARFSQSLWKIYCRSRIMSNRFLCRHHRRFFLPTVTTSFSLSCCTAVAFFYFFIAVFFYTFPRTEKKRLGDSTYYLFWEKSRKIGIKERERRVLF